MVLHILGRYLCSLQVSDQLSSDVNSQLLLAIPRCGGISRGTWNGICVQVTSHSMQGTSKIVGHMCRCPKNV